MAIKNNNNNNNNELVERFGRRPIPDPTELTTELTLREIANLKEVIETRLDGMDKAIALVQVFADKNPDFITDQIEQLHQLHDEKFHSIGIQFSERDLRYTKINEESEKAIGAALKAAQRAFEEQSSAINKQILQLQELHDEKFRSIGTQFSERDIRTEQTSRDSKVAVDAALQAAKEAVGEQNKSSALAIAKSEASTTKQIDQIGLIINSMAKNFDDKIDDMKTRLTTIEGMRHGFTTNFSQGLTIISLIISVAAIGLMIFIKTNH